MTDLKKNRNIDLLYSKNYRKSGKNEFNLCVKDERLHEIFRSGGRLLNCRDPIMKFSFTIVCPRLW